MMVSEGKRFMARPSFAHPLRMRREHPRAWTWMVTMLMAGLSLVIGLGVSIYDGVLNPLVEPAILFVLLGLIAFYIPGLLMAAAAIGLRRGWLRMVKLGALAALAQGFMALVATFGHPIIGYFSVLVLIEGLLWTAADFYVAWGLWRALPWVLADAEAKPGFELEAIEAEAV